MGAVRKYEKSIEAPPPPIPLCLLTNSVHWSLPTTLRAPFHLPFHTSTTEYGRTLWTGPLLSSASLISFCTSVLLPNPKSYKSPQSKVHLYCTRYTEYHHSVLSTLYSLLSFNAAQPSSSSMLPSPLLLPLLLPRTRHFPKVCFSHKPPVSTGRRNINKVIWPLHPSTPLSTTESLISA